MASRCHRSLWCNSLGANAFLTDNRIFKGVKAIDILILDKSLKS